jgi:hypothetical protein
MGFHRLKIIKCKPIDDYKLWLLFDDGTAGEVDLKNLVGKGVFSAWNSIEFFNSVHIDKKSDTVTWGEDLDLDPYVLYKQIHSKKHS